MKRKLKVAVIGAGSTYTPELINGFITRKEVLDISHFYFMDINEEKLRVIGGLAKRMLEAHQMPCKLILTTDLEEAVKDADYVLTQIRVGMLEARIRDERIPLKHSLLGQETTGAGGFMKALRTIPVMMDIAKTIERLAPNAWLINFSNPSGIVADAVLNYTKVKTIGLCNGPINMIKGIKEQLPEGIQAFDYDFVGLNHLCWITGIYTDGINRFDDYLKKNTNLDGLKNNPSVVYDEELLRAVKGLPISYLNYYYFKEDQIHKYINAEKTRGEVCQEIEKELLELYKDKNLREKPAVLDQRGGALYSEAAVSLIDAIENDKNEVHVVDVKNNGAYSFMDDDDIVEIKCMVNKGGAVPIKLENFNNEHIIGLMRSVKAYEKLTVKAALTGDYNIALSALLTHPLIGDYVKAKAVLDEMLEANKAFLPQFYE